MKRTLIHLVFGLALSGCTINQYGPSVLVEDRAIEIKQTQGEDKRPRRTAEPKRDVNKQTIHATTPPTEKPVPRSKARPCIAPPKIPEPPQISVEMLQRYKDNPDMLDKLFKADHAALYGGWKEIHQKRTEWEKNPNKC